MNLTNLTNKLIERAIEEFGKNPYSEKQQFHYISTEDLDPNNDIVYMSIIDFISLSIADLKLEGWKWYIYSNGSVKLIRKKNRERRIW